MTKKIILSLKKIHFAYSALHKHPQSYAPNLRNIQIQMPVKSCAYKRVWYITKWPTKNSANSADLGERNMYQLLIASKTTVCKFQVRGLTALTALNPQ